MPGLGTLMVKGRIFGVKFEDNLSETAKLAPNKLSQTKKHINLNSEVVGKNAIAALPELNKNLTTLRPKTYKLVNLDAL
jgi:hypothetical protein